MQVLYHHDIAFLDAVWAEAHGPKATIQTIKPYNLDGFIYKTEHKNKPIKTIPAWF